MAESNFVDYVKIYCRSGKGGRGSTHMRREKYTPNGGPDGGDGVRTVVSVKTERIRLLKFPVVRWFTMPKQVNMYVM